VQKIMINSFSQFLVEEEKTVYFTFGRLNPPTIGHEMLLNKLARAAGKNPYKIYLSKSSDPKKNPLSYNDKIKFARKMFPKHARQIIKNNKMKTVMDIASALFAEGYINIVMAGDGERSREFDILLNKYNGVKGRHGFYNFKSIKFVNVGERNDSSDDIDGVSATKQRNSVKNNDFVAFTQGLPKSMSNSDAKQLFNAVRKGMGLKEAKEFKRHVQLEPVSDLREAYVNNSIFEEGESVVMTKTGIVGNIKHLGTNYLIVESKDETWRCWLTDVEKVDLNEAAGPRWKKAGPDGEVEIKFPTGRRFKVEKQYDSNIRHKGEWKVMEWDTRSKDWEWGDTYSPKAYAKEMAMKQGQYKNGKKIADYSSTFKFESVNEENQPEWGTPESTKKAKKITPGEKYDEACWDSHKQVGMKKKGNKMVPNCVPKEAAQDSDIKDRPGSQPAGYHKGLSKAQKVARDRQFKKQAKMSDSDPKAYKKAPGDHGAKTKLSKHTLKYRRMFGEQDTQVDKAKAKIDREKESDKRKHDRMMDTARMRDTKKINRSSS